MDIIFLQLDRLAMDNIFLTTMINMPTSQKDRMLFHFFLKFIMINQTNDTSDKMCLNFVFTEKDRLTRPSPS